MKGKLFKKYWKMSILCLLSATSASALRVGEDTSLIDLTYPFGHQTIYWPTEKGFQLDTVYYGKTPKGYFYSAYKFCAPEHGGTHVDAPRHFSKHGLTVDKISVEALRGNALVIEVTAQVQNHRDYAIRSEDIKQFEKRYGLIHQHDIVLFYTGWGRYWHDKKRYLGSDKLGDTKNLHFPGISKEAAEYLATKKVAAIGLDTPSLDPGPSSEFWAHRIILGANIYGIENLAKLQELPPVGSVIIVAPLKIENGSGAPARVFAIAPKKLKYTHSH